MGVVDLLERALQLVGLVVLLGFFHTLWLATWTAAFDAKSDWARTLGIVLTLIVVVAWGATVFLIAQGLAV